MWAEIEREAYPRDRVYVIWRCRSCKRKAVTIGSDKPTACCCRSKPTDAGPALGPDPSGGKWRPFP